MYFKSRYFQNTRRQIDSGQGPRSSQYQGDARDMYALSLLYPASNPGQQDERKFKWPEEDF